MNQFADHHLDQGHRLLFASHARRPSPNSKRASGMTTRTLCSLQQYSDNGSRPSPELSLPAWLASLSWAQICRAVEPIPRRWERSTMDHADHAEPASSRRSIVDSWSLPRPIRVTTGLDAGHTSRPRPPGSYAEPDGVARSPVRWQL